MANYRDLNFDNGQYVQQYAGIPLDQIQHTADTLSTRHYSNIAQATQLEILANQMKSKLLPGAKGYVDQHVSALDGALQDMAANGGENSTSRINALASKLQGDQGILNGLQRSQEYQQQSQLIDQLTSKGEIPLYDKERRSALENASATDDIYNTPYSSLVEPYKDPNPDMKAIWDEVNPDSFEGELHVAMNSKTGQPLATALGNSDLSAFYESITSGGISGKKIKEKLEGAWSNYKQTESFKQQTGKLVGKSEAQVKQEFLNKGLTKVFSNLKRDYKTPPASATRGAGKGQPYAAPFLTPGVVTTQTTPYGDDGKPTTSIGDLVGSTPFRDPGERKMLTPEEQADIKAKDKLKEETFHPQYIKDAEAWANSAGVKYSNDPSFLNKPETLAGVKAYNQSLAKRVNNTWAYEIPHDISVDMTDDIQRRWGAAQYMDQNGKVINALDEKGNPTEEFKELTGGNPNAFKVESVYDVKNPFATMTDNDNFAQPIAVTSVDKDGKPRRFIMSQLPGYYNTTPEELNTNKIYSLTNRQPGGTVELGQGVKAMALAGRQLDQYLTPDEQQIAPYPVAVSIPGVKDGKMILYSSAEEAAQVAAKNGIYLKREDK